jgi:hypothetical protein
MLNLLKSKINQVRYVHETYSFMICSILKEFLYPFQYQIKSISIFFEGMKEYLYKISQKITYINF